MSDDDSAVPLIRTGLRDKLPRGLSHAVGAEIISRALRGCPRYDELWIAFGSDTLPLHPAPPEAADFRLGFSLVCNNRSGGWYLSVPAVPSDERAFVRHLLVATGLAAVREWLFRPRSETWYEGFRTFEIGYSVNPPRICTTESFNHRTVNSSIRVLEDANA